VKCSFTIFLLFVTLIGLGGCKTQPQGQVIARVGDAVLTMEEARQAIDTTRGTTDDQIQRYVAIWVNNQLLYQEAQREGIDEEDSFHREMEDTRQRLAIHSLLQKRIYSDTSGLEEGNLRAYFDKHKGEFFAREDMVKLNEIGFLTREQASDFADKVSRNNLAWIDALRQLRSDTAAAASVVSSSFEQFFSQHTLIPVELWKVAQALNTGEISFPVKTNLGYYVIQLLETVPAGKPAELDIARAEVGNRSLIDRRRHLYEEYLGTLRKQYNVEILLNSSTRGDSTQIQNHE
jgi:parvulin-like peptidyl-prolyl isomerase